MSYCKFQPSKGVSLLQEDASPGLLEKKSEIKKERKKRERERKKERVRESHGSTHSSSSYTQTIKRLLLFPIQAFVAPLKIGRAHV